MALVRWEPVRELNTLQNEVNRLFSSFFDTPTTRAAENGGRRWFPAMDLVETHDDFVLRADLPGLDASDVDIEVEDGVLTISGERKAQHEEGNEGYYRVERSFGAFRRSLSLPDGVEADRIAADFDKGVLEVRIPKPEQRKPHKVQVQVGAGPEKAEPALEGTESAA